MAKLLKTAFLVAILFPIIISQLGGVDTSGWNSTLVTIWTNLPIFAGIGILFMFLKFAKFGEAKGKI